MQQTWKGRLNGNEFSLVEPCQRFMLGGQQGWCTAVQTAQGAGIRIMMMGQVRRHNGPSA